MLDTIVTIANITTTHKTKIRADMIADDIGERILNGELCEGDAI